MTTERLSPAVRERAHQPHDPASTVDLAAATSAAVHALVYATRPATAGQAIARPDTLYDLVEALVGGPRDLGQLMRQCEAWLRGELEADHLTVNEGPNAGRPGRAYAQAAGDFDAVRAAATALAHALVQLQNTLADIGSAPGAADDR